MTTRVLPVGEYDRLNDTYLAPLAGYLPEDAQVVVVEDDGRIIACWAMFFMPHVEGVWIHPDYQRRGGAARRLLRGMRDTAARLRVERVVTAAITPDVADLLVRLGAKQLEGTHYVLPLREH
jgi:N-acetylglutamate synthase-like GNAT family acetyltransferase